MRLLPLPLLLLAVAAGLSVAGCDRQNTAASQPKAAIAESDATGGDNDEQSGGADAAPVNRIDRTHAGAAMPDTLLHRPDASRGKLSSLIGKPTLVNLWATWCAPCVHELPAINQVAQEIGDNGQVVTVSQDIQLDSAGVARWLADHGWTAVASWHDPDSATGSAYGGGLPITLLYDKRGREVLRVTGPMDWHSPEALALLREAGFVIGAS